MVLWRVDVIQKFWGISSGFKRTVGSSIGFHLAGSFLAVFSPLALAQGQGSYGGYLGGLVMLILGAGLLVALVALFVIYKVFGGKSAAVVLVLLLSSVAVFVVTARYEEKQRLDSYQVYLDGVQSDCLRQGGETILARATGQEMVFVNIRGEASIPDFQKEVLLKKTKLAPGISFAEDEPTIAPGAGAVLVDIAYSRLEVVGSLPNAGRFSTHVQVEIKKAADGAVLAKRTDIELRQGFCLGPDPVQGIIGFMRTVLNRPDIQELSGRTPHPFHYTPVVARTTEKTGQFQKISTEELIKKPHEKDRWTDQRMWMGAIPTCPVKEVVLSSPVATCAPGERHENQLNLYGLVGIAQRADSWFAVLQDFRAMRGMDALRIEQRDFSGKPLKGWIVNFPFPEDKEFGSPQVESVTLNGNQLVIVANWKMKSCFTNECQNFRGNYFQRQTIISATLQGL